MERTQVYLPKSLKKRLHRQARHSDSNLSDILRKAAADYLDKQEHAQEKTDARFRKALALAFGLWKNRDPVEFETIRRSADRRLDEWGI